MPKQKGFVPKTVREDLKTRENVETLLKKYSEEDDLRHYRREHNQVKCFQCEKWFTPYGYSLSSIQPRFCSKKCRSTWLEAHPKTCAHCGKPYVCSTMSQYNSNGNDKGRKYCSAQCCRLHENRKVCYGCGKELLTREQRDRHFCNDQCVEAYYAKLRLEAQKNDG